MELLMLEEELELLELLKIIGLDQVMIQEEVVLEQSKLYWELGHLIEKLFMILEHQII